MYIVFSSARFAYVTRHVVLSDVMNFPLLMMAAFLMVKVTQHAVQWSYGIVFFQTELMVIICSKSLVRAIG